MQRAELLHNKQNHNFLAGPGADKARLNASCVSLKFELFQELRFLINL
jgi:hypothetical protein